MVIGLIGAGRLSQAIAGHALKAGHQVIFSNSRGPDTLTDLVTALGSDASAGTVEQAGAADFVVLAVNWDRVREALSALPSRAGRILIDATNQWATPPPESVIDELDTSGSEFVASLVPGTHVIKAFDNIYSPKVAADPVTELGRRILFYAGDDDDAKKRFAALVDGFGFAPVDLGPLAMGRLMQVDGPLTGLHAIREAIGHPMPAHDSTSVVPADLSPGTWVIDPTHSSITFSVRHFMVSKVRGAFNQFSGTLDIGGDGAPTVSADIDVASVDTNNGDRDTHLLSADFFDTERFPTASFVSTRVLPDGDNYILRGDFTLKGHTKSVDLAFGYNGVSTGMGRGPAVGFTASVVLNRKDFGIDINIPMDTGGVVVGDTITIALDIEALQQH